MNTSRTLVTTIALACAFAGTTTLASAQAVPATVVVVHGSVDGHAYLAANTAKAPLPEMEGGLPSYDLQLTLSQGPHNTEASDVKLTITDAAGWTVFLLDKAGPLLDVDLPTGYYHVLADFGRVKRMGDVEVVNGELATLYLHARNDAL